MIRSGRALEKTFKNCKDFLEGQRQLLVLIESPSRSNSVLLNEVDVSVFTFSDPIQILEATRVKMTRANCRLPIPFLVSAHFIPVCKLLLLSIPSVPFSPVVINNTWLFWRKLSILVLLFSPNNYLLLWLLCGLRSLPLHVPSMFLLSFSFFL